LKILAVVDSPTCSTGFARVAQNLLRRWHEVPGTQIDVWAINYAGWPHDLPYRLFPAAPASFAEYRNPERLSALIDRIRVGRYTAVWFLNDLFAFSRHNFPQLLKAACEQAGTQSFFYFPVDSDLDPAWLDILEAVDVAVSYTHYGLGQVSDELAKRVRVLPHGVDTAVYRPLPDRARLRAELFENGWVQPEDVLLLNVSQNQKRKDVARSLAVLARLRARGVPAKLLMHMPRMSNDGSTDLEAVSRQLGLVPGEFWAHTGGLWHCNTPKQGEGFLNALYNAADLLISTSLGEGWGLPITEALAAGCPVAVPEHTACEEIAAQANRMGMGAQVMLLELDRNPTVLPYDNSRVRFGVNVEAAAHQIDRFGTPPRACSGLSQGMREWLDWDRLANEWMTLFAAELIRFPAPAVEVKEAVLPEFNFRQGTTDVYIFDRVVLRNGYDLPREFAPGDLVIDVGVHTGCFSYDVLRRGAEVIGFEPDPDNFALARRNLKEAIDSNRMWLLQSALWRSDVAVPLVALSPWVVDGDVVDTGSAKVDNYEFDCGPLRVAAALPMDGVIGGRTVRLLKLSCSGSEWPILYTSSRLPQVREIVGVYTENTGGIAGQSCRMATLKVFLERLGFSVSCHANVDGGSTGVFRAINQREVGK
jgi:FkbM family methyltransferase